MFALVKNLQSGRLNTVSVDEIYKIEEVKEKSRTFWKRQPFRPADDSDFIRKENYGVVIGDDIVRHYILLLADSRDAVIAKKESARPANPMRMSYGNAAISLKAFIDEDILQEESKEATGKETHTTKNGKEKAIQTKAFYGSKPSELKVEASVGASGIVASTPKEGRGKAAKFTPSEESKTEAVDVEETTAPVPKKGKGKALKNIKVLPVDDVKAVPANVEISTDEEPPKKGKGKEKTAKTAPSKVSKVAAANVKEDNPLIIPGYGEETLKICDVEGEVVDIFGTEVSHKPSKGKAKKVKITPSDHEKPVNKSDGDSQTGFMAPSVGVEVREDDSGPLIKYLAEAQSQIKMLKHQNAWLKRKLVRITNVIEEADEFESSIHRYNEYDFEDGIEDQEVGISTKRRKEEKEEIKK